MLGTRALAARSSSLDPKDAAPDLLDPRGRNLSVVTADGDSGRRDTITNLAALVPHQRTLDQGSVAGGGRADSRPIAHRDEIGGCFKQWERATSRALTVKPPLGVLTAE